MNPLNALQSVFTSPALNAATWGFASSFILCIVLVLTKRWHGALTMDFTNGVQKFHTAPTPRITPNSYGVRALPLEMHLSLIHI